MYIRSYPPPVSLTPSNTQLRALGGEKRRGEKKRRKARSNPLGHPTLLWEEQDLPQMLSYLDSLHLQVRTQGSLQSLVSANSTATALRCSQARLGPPHIPAGHRGAGGETKNKDL